MDQRADLHLHTTASDGALSPTKMVESAATIGLSGIAITDHDTVDGIEEALRAGRKLDIDVIPGIEISSIYQDKIEVHILGYFVDHHNEVFVEKLKILKNARWERGMKMVERLNSAGIAISFERVIEIAQGGAIGRPHIARAMHEIGVVSSMDSAFGKYLQYGGIGYVPRYKVTPSEAVQMILDAGGVPGCAHVAKLKRDELIVSLMSEGLRAVEVYHPDHGPASSRFYRKFAEKRELIVTGGSDAHCFKGDKHPGVGAVSVPYDVVEQLRNAVCKPD